VCSSDLDSIDVVAVDWDSDADPPRYDAGDDGAATLTVRPLQRTRPLDTWWRRGSWSGLIRDRVDGVPRDHDDEPTAAGGGGFAAVGTEPVAMAEFEAGMRAGRLLHGILEVVDFQDPDSLEPLVAEHLAAAGIDSDCVRSVTHGLDLAIRTPLEVGGFSLADLPRSSRLDELEFTIPVRGGFDASTSALTTLGLAQVFDDGGGPGLPDGWADELRRLRFLPLRGFLGGFIDLVFVHEGRWYVVDYKSNKLGTRYADYAKDRLAEPMVHGQYVLQYHLYALALHRYLGLRLPDYDYETSFGGVYYLFLRGMRPDLGPTHGVFADRPTRELMDRLELTLCGANS
jgi:exodeoxyribonuclease V beta subunit